MMAAHRVHAVEAAPPAAKPTISSVPPPKVEPPPTPAVEEPQNYSLKDISREAARQAERELILKMLRHTRWNRKETADLLGISYKALLYKIKENGLNKVT